MRGRIKGAAAVCALLVAGLATGCTTESSAVSRPAASASGSASSAAPSVDPRAAVEAAYRKWGLKPLAQPPAPPAKKPVRLGAGGRIPVISEIPTKDKVVFLTYDDGTEQDPQFITMMRELKIPITMFLTDAAIRSDYGYFTKLQALGNPVENHTLTHPNLPTLGADAQKREICGQQTKLTEHYGTAPRLFRPPYGNWNEATRAAAASCGLQAIVLWRESMQIKNMQYQLPGKKLRPGDIILAHFRGPSELKGRTITQMTVNMLRHIEEQGFTVARLEDYL
ncbi:polysaccharide deacetylase family protein [Streptomyces roseirectus]|uniref:Polysaccharide deacetylase family protein n=1 Tax=Streptomyces roseirectus TaxID=2768066 RepID=A0A7H0I7P7_9ACTN|nr:polysaccharide deacetylase family protein [Streptomyces roseirectus]QNP68813.1 polysaccharide deacetylase family protein [Streptomyces roseirectus]